MTGHAIPMRLPSNQVIKPFQFVGLLSPSEEWNLWNGYELSKEEQCYSGNFILLLLHYVTSRN